MRVLIADLGSGSRPVPGSTLSDAGLAELYAWQPRDGAWVRANYAASLDGAITGPDGRSGSINTEADHVVFELLRALSHVVVVGAGTLRSEGYRWLTVEKRWQQARSALDLPPSLPLVAVTNTGRVPPLLAGGPPGRVLLATHAAASGLDEARATLGRESVLLCGEDSVDVRRLVEALASRGWTRILSEGGPHLTSSMITAGVLDELCLSVTPVVAGGPAPRLTSDSALGVGFSPRVLVEEEGTVMGRWFRTG